MSPVQVEVHSMINVCQQHLHWTSVTLAVEVDTVIEKCRALMTRYNKHKDENETHEDEKYALIHGPEKVTQVFTNLLGKLRRETHQDGLIRAPQKVTQVFTNLLSKK